MSTSYLVVGAFAAGLTVGVLLAEALTAASRDDLAMDFLRWLARASDEDVARPCTAVEQGDTAHSATPTTPRVLHEAALVEAAFAGRSTRTFTVRASRTTSSAEQPQQRARQRRQPGSEEGWRGVYASVAPRRYTRCSASSRSPTPSASSASGRSVYVRQR